MAWRKTRWQIPPKQCEAMSKQNKRRCKNYCIPGWNVCKFHGANGGQMPVHGMYSEKVNQSLAKRYEEFLEHGDTLESLNSDIALMRAMMVETLHGEAETAQEKQYQMNMFLRYMRDIREATSMKDDIESKFSVSLQTVQIFLNQVLFILQDTIKDEDELEKVVSRLRKIKLLDENDPKLLSSKK